MTTVPGVYNTPEFPGEDVLEQEIEAFEAMINGDDKDFPVDYENDLFTKDGDDASSGEVFSQALQDIMERYEGDNTKRGISSTDIDDLVQEIEGLEEEAGKIR